jgi:hypothetical protein
MIAKSKFSSIWMQHMGVKIAHFTDCLRTVRPVSVEGVIGEFSRMTRHLYRIGLRDDLPSLNAQGHNTVS